MELCVPDSDSGYYRGTLFDWSGVFRTIKSGKEIYADEWFEEYDPYRHDCICGPIDEFAPVGYDDTRPGGSFLKIGVGLLKRPDKKEYDKFRLYDIVNSGVRTTESGKGSVRFRHLLTGERYGYDYVKEISLSETDRAFTIEYRLLNLGPEIIRTSVYKHNLPNIRQKGTIPTNNGTFDAVCDELMDQATLQKGHRTACVEPYIKLRLFPGESAEWSINYSLS